MSDIQAVILDIGGVVIATHEERTAAAVARACPFTPQEIFAKVHYSSDMAQKLDVGQWTLEQGFEFLRQKLQLSMSYQEFHAAWMDMLGEDFPEVRSAVAALPPDVGVYTLSNTNHAHLDALRKHWLFERSRRFFVSCEIGLRKPDHDLFRYVLEQIGLPGEQTLFFDDREANVVAADAVGIRSVLVTEPAVVPRTLRELGLLT